ncbi:RHS repeat domain-containing protein, partial [Pseudomonas monteilii]
GRTTHYVFEPGTFVPVAQGVMNHIEEMLHQPRYAFPYDIDRDPVWQHKPTPKPFDTFGWYQCDQLGTPMEATGVSGQILWKGNYKAWGCTVEQTTTDSPEHECNIRFQGQHFDVETGLHYNRYRYYSPAIGRFVSKDPVGFLGELNIFSFAENPIQWIDPYGLKKKAATSCCPAEIDPCAGDGKTHIVYQAPDPKHKDAGGNPLIYTGKASGHGSVEDVLKKRFSGGHHRKISHDDATIVFETDSYATVRGLEHLAYLDLGTLATRQNNPVGPRNSNKPNYIECAERQLRR